MKIVLDTNVLLVSISDRAREHWVFLSFLDEAYTLCVTTDILTEYEEVIARHMGREAADATLGILENAPNVQFITRYFKWNLIHNDPDDNKFVDCAIAANANFIVSEDKHFKILEQVEFPKVSVLSISSFKDELLWEKPLE